MSRLNRKRHDDSESECWRPRCDSAFNPKAFRQRNHIERPINRPQRHRAISIRYGELAPRNQAMLMIAAVPFWIWSLPTPLG
jgi:transposase